MPRSRKGVTRPPIDLQGLEAAISEIREGCSINKAAKAHNITRSVLQSYTKKFVGETPVELNKNCAVRKVFTVEEEKDLVSYLVLCSRLMHGLTLKSLSKVAFDFAAANTKKIPESWKENKKAGRQWVHAFMKRHKELTLRSPQATSIGRAMCFNKPVVDAYFTTLGDLLNKYRFEPAQIWNVDESGLSTVQNPPRVIAAKGVKAVGAITSAERGTNVTAICAINALGNSLPPILVFPRVRFHDHMMNGAPPGAIGFANPSGWSNSEIFLKFMEHLIHHTNSNPEKKIFLLLDNHESHLSIDVINLAKSNGVVMFTFPPHTTHRLQPLDRAVFGPFKTFYNQEMTLYMQNNPNKPISIYEVAGIFGKAYPRAFTPVNIQGGFRGCGIEPFNPYLFNEEDFLPSAPSHRPLPSIEPPSASTVQFPECVIPSAGLLAKPTVATTISHPASDSCLTDSPAPGSSIYKSPQEIRPLPSRSPTDPKKKRRRLGKSRILTDTPEKEELEKLAEARRSKSVAATRKRIFHKLPVKKPKNYKKPKRQVRETTTKTSSSSSDDEDDIVSLHDESDVDFDSVADEVLGSEPQIDYQLQWDADRVENNVNKWALVKFSCANGTKFYVGIIVGVSKQKINIKFARKKKDKFVWPPVEDLYPVEVKDIEKLIPDPVEDRWGKMSFPISFQGLNVL